MIDEFLVHGLFTYRAPYCTLYTEAIIHLEGNKDNIWVSASFDCVFMGLCPVGSRE